MANPTTSTALYERFLPAERLVLLLEAMARGDEAEVERVQRTCPRRTYSQADAAFQDRYEMALDVTVVACGELRALLAQLRMLWWAGAVARQAGTSHKITATMAFLDGVRQGKGLGQTPFFRLGLRKRVRAVQQQEEAGGPAREDMDAEEEDDEEEPQQTLGEEFYRRMHAVERRGERWSRRMEWVFRRAEADLVSELKSIWAAYEGFCCSRVGMGAYRVLEACGWPGGQELKAVLERHKHVAVDQETVTSYQNALCGYWDRQFGTGE